MVDGTAVCTSNYPNLPKDPAFANQTCNKVYDSLVNDSDLDRNSVALTSDAAGHPAVYFKYNGESSKILAEFTAQNIGKPMSIVVDQRVISSPQINGSLPGEGIITFGSVGTKQLQEQQAKKLMAQLKSPRLPIRLKVSE